MRLPKIKPNLLVQELNGETLIYDQTTHHSYCLNRTAQIVFNHCDGQKTFADVDLPEDMIYFALDELRRRELIESGHVSPFAGMDRRAVVRRVGLASLIALPLISGLLAPPATQAASGCALGGQACTTSDIFLQGTCCADLRCNGRTCENCIQQGQGFATGRCNSAGSCDVTCNQPNDANRRRCCTTQGQATNTYNAGAGGIQFVTCQCP